MAAAWLKRLRELVLPGGTFITTSWGSWDQEKLEPHINQWFD